MSEKKIKCAICDRVAEGDDCQLMTVIVDEHGKKTKICCSHMAEQKK